MDTMQKAQLIKQGLLQFIALLFLNIIALVYDDFYLYTAVVIDSAILGYLGGNLAQVIVNGKKKEVDSVSYKE